jgi:hypothetical protein
MKHAIRVVRCAVVANARRLLVGKVLHVDGEGLLLAWEAHAWAFDATLLHRDHESAYELVPALKTEQLVLPVRLVEEHDIQSKRMDFGDFSQLCEDVGLVLALLGLDKFEQTLTELVDLIKRRSELDYNRNSFGKSSGSSLVEDEKSV